MDRNPQKERLSTYIIHPHRVVADDLRDILQNLGIANVQIAARVAEVPAGRAALIVLGGQPYGSDYATHLAHWVALSVPIVILNGLTCGPTGVANMVHLSQPFRSEDVAEALVSLGVF